jgi:hydrogenase 3 maturation protease
LPPSWKNSLIQLLNQSTGDDHPGYHPQGGFPRTCLVGIGSDLRGDDSAGLVVVRALLDDEHRRNTPDLLIIEGGPAPENHTSKIRSFQPELVVFVDAAQMDELPGTIRWIPLDTIDGMSASTHSMPLSILARFLTLELACKVAVLGIQPGQNAIGAELTPPVHAAVDEIVGAICDLPGLNRPEE